MTNTSLKNLKLEADNEYQEVFRAAMKKYGIKSPNELDDEKKKKFFEYVDSQWTSKKESRNPLSEISFQKKSFSPNETITEEELTEWVGNFGNYGEHFYNEDNTFSKALSDVSDMVRAASQHIVESSEDWFGKISLKKDAKKFEGHAKEIDRIKEQVLALKKEATLVFEECGGLLSRYYSIKKNK